jgi:catechol 2,3-dioxygenase-like lactoylglutathione lyase family enzyme
MRPLLGLRSAFYAAPDIVAARDWYARALGVAPYFDEPFYVGFELGGYELGLVPDEPPNSGGVAWGVTDIHAAVAHFLQVGATEHTPAHEVGGGIFVARVKDPFGNVLGLIQNPHFKGGI